MKKHFTFFFLLVTTFLLHAQIVISDELVIADFEGDEASWSYELESSWEYTVAEVADNPSKSGINESDKVFKTTRNAGNWNSGFKFAWTSPVTVGERNFMRVKVYAPDRNTFVYLKLISNDAVVKEGWAGMPVQSNDAWGYAVQSLGGVTEFDKIEVYLSDNWGNTDAEGTAYVDDFEMYKESYEYQDAFMDMVYMAPQTTETMDIDGLDLEDVWLDANVEEFVDEDENITYGTWSSVWDSEYLYFFFQGDVDYVHTWQDENWAEWKGDGLQVYMDVLARRVDGRVFGNMNGFAVCPDLESQAAIEQLWDLGYKAYLPFGDDYVPLSKQGSFITGTGYTIEIALPWKGLAFAAGEEMQDEVQWVADNVTAGLEIALALQMNIADQTGARTNAVNWLPEGGYSNSGNWGGLELAGAVGIETSVGAGNLNIYPSVTNGLLNIEMQNLKSVEIFDVSGKAVFSRKLNSDHAQLDVSSFQKGLYIIQANDGVTHFVNKFIRQ